MQQTLGFEDMYTRGGWRPGSGRKRNKQTISHGVREFGYSSGDSFDGWLDHQPTDDPTRPRSYVSPPGFKLAVLWKRHHAPISLRAVPGH